MIDKEWIYNNVDGEPQAQEAILKLALNYENHHYYKDLKTLCREAGLYPAETRAIMEWVEGGTDDYTNEINRLFSYLEFSIPDLFNKCVLEYYNKLNNLSSYQFIKR